MLENSNNQRLMERTFRTFHFLVCAYIKKATILTADLALALACLPAALFLRLDPVPAKALVSSLYPKHVILAFLVYFGSFWGFRTYRTIVRLANLHTALRVTAASAIAGTVYFVLATVFFDLPVLPRSVYLIQILLFLPLALAFRFSFRIAQELRNRTGQTGQPTLIYGAGTNTHRVLPALLANRGHFRILGILDDNPAKVKADIQGVRVLGSGKDFARIVQRTGATQLILSIPSATGAEIRRILGMALEHKLQVRIMPSPDNALVDPATQQSPPPRELRIEDLLQRPPRKIDRDQICAAIQGKVVLVTGGGGSIGSELCRQIAQLAPKLLIINDASEFALYRIHEEFTSRYPGVAMNPHLGSMADPCTVKNLFEKYKIDVVFHACAYKHVPMVEYNVATSVLNNIQAAHLVFSAARERGSERVILISTDKAVRPTNVMGATKRACELLALWHNQRPGCTTSYSCVRFGNVLGSNGSVIPKFVRQISAGGPVTVTHPEMTRYFMLIPEAVSLVLQAATTNRSGEIFLLNMGEPVNISNMARDLIRLMGREPDSEIKIEFTGLRPGEKLYEELHLDAEMLEPVTNDYSRISRHVSFDSSFEATIARILMLAREGNEEGARRALFDLIKSAELDGQKTAVDFRSSPLNESPLAVPVLNFAGEPVEVLNRPH